MQSPSYDVGLMYFKRIHQLVPILYSYI